MKSMATSQRDPRLNNLDSLRLMLALFVVLEHANNLFHVAAGQDHRFDFFLFNLSDVAVSSFFVISGMLTYVSYQRDPDLLRFYLRRLFRIFPAYWSVVLLQVVVFCLLASTLVQWDELPFYLLVNGITANFLSGTFIEDVPAINGSLWTIKVETSYYLLLPALFPLMRRTPLLLVLSLLSLVWAVSVDHPSLVKQLPGKLYLFAIGIVLAKQVKRLTDHHSLVALLALPFVLASKFAFEDVLLLSEVTEAMVGVLCVVAFMRQWIVREPLDISYTLYLVHYPVLVLLTRILLPGQSFAVILGVGVALSVAVAVTISLLIERPALGYGRRLVARIRTHGGVAFLVGGKL